jgi:hypothetical protein
VLTENRAQQLAVMSNKANARGSPKFKDVNGWRSTSGQGERELQGAEWHRLPARISRSPLPADGQPRRARAGGRFLSPARAAERARMNGGARSARKCQLAKQTQDAVLAIARREISCGLLPWLVGAPDSPAGRLECSRHGRSPHRFTLNDQRDRTGGSKVCAIWTTRSRVDVAQGE